jgi:hypothetical protein
VSAELGIAPALAIRRDGPRAERLADPARDVRAENVAAAHASLEPHSAIWMLACETQRQLEGAVLPLERRERLVQFAKEIGIRPFDANVVIAMAQDRARRGACMEGLDRLFVGAVAASRPDAARAWPASLPYLAASAAGVIAGAAAIAWIMS